MCNKHQGQSTLFQNPLLCCKVFLATHTWERKKDKFKKMASICGQQQISVVIISSTHPPHSWRNAFCTEYLSTRSCSWWAAWTTKSLMFISGTLSLLKSAKTDCVNFAQFIKDLSEFIRQSNQATIKSVHFIFSVERGYLSQWNLNSPFTW